MHVSSDYYWWTSSTHTGFPRISWDMWKPKGFEGWARWQRACSRSLQISAKAQWHSWTDGLCWPGSLQVLWQSLPSFCSHTQQCVASWLSGEFSQSQVATQGRAISISSQGAIQRGMKLSVTAQKRALRAKQTGCYSWCVEKFSSSFPLQYA